MAKVPKSEHNPSTSKIPVTTKDPVDYKFYPVSWQIGSIDKDSKWGLVQVVGKFKFNYNGKLLHGVVNHNLERLDEILTSLDGKFFDSIDQFLSMIERRVTPSDFPHEVIMHLCKEIGNYVFWIEVQPKLREFERLNWEELESQIYHARKGPKTKHHYINTEKLVKDAQKRLEELKLDDYEQVFSIRLNSTFRLFGIRQYGFFRLLWIDPNHEICPSSVS